MAKPNQIIAALSNGEVPLAHRYQQMADLMHGAAQGEKVSAAVAGMVFQKLEAVQCDEMAAKRAKFLQDLLKQLDSAPLRPATFIGMSNINSEYVPHALVTMDNGENAYVCAYDPVMASKLKLGDRVMVDATSKLLMYPALTGLYFGGEARFERVVDDKHIEVVSHQDEKSVVLAGEELIKQVESGEVKPGAPIVLASGNRVALKALPAAKETYYRFLDRGAIPDVRVERDIGNPPRVIAEVELHVREEMTRPDLRRKFRLRPCITRLLCGVSGTGKSLSIAAMHRKMYEVMSEVTGAALEELPPRVFRCRSSQMLSMWFGESDKNIDRLFDEVEEVASKPWKNKRGKEFTLPVMVVLEEADGLGRARGQDNVYDRIMTVILQRLDPNREGLSDKLVVFISTTNEPEIVDPAFLRRIGGTVETFGRLNQQGFNDIIRKHVSGLPAEDGDWDEILGSVDQMLFDPDKDPGVVELTYQGHNQPVTKYRRDFLTGALIDRAVQQAASEAWRLAIDNKPGAGVSAQLLAKAINHQVLSVAHQLHEQNVHNYLDIPDGTKVARVRRIYADDVSVSA